MAVEMRHNVVKSAEAVEEQGAMGADLLTGAAAAAVETVAHPGRTMRKLERKGAPINREIRTSSVRRADHTANALQAYLPEQIVLGGLRLVKERARRKDLIGTIAYRTLEVINDGLGVATSVVKRMERASTPPSRGTAKAPLKTTVGQAKTAVRKTAAKATTKGRSTARRATTATTRRTNRKATTSTRTIAGKTPNRVRRSTPSAS